MASIDPSAKPAEILKLEITDLSRGGAGVARDPNGRVIFVPLTAPGDIIHAKIVGETKHYAQAELVEMIEPSLERETPRCKVFGKCGGCQWQHLTYALQWKTKSLGVRHALSRVQVGLPELWVEMPATQVWEYRNRIQLRGFREKIGYFAPKSHQLVAIDRCDVARAEINAALPEIQKEGSVLSKPYKVEIEVSPTGGVIKSWNTPHAAMGFRQLHDEQNDYLRSFVSEQICDGAVVWDLYGGSGNLSFDLAHRLSEIHCVDTSSPAHAPEGTPKNYHFHRSQVFTWLTKISRQKNSAPKGHLSIILDPPREGLGDFRGEMAVIFNKMGAKDLIMVGCDADSWARDLAKMIQHGWKLEKAAILDLFPQTPHIECIAVLRAQS